jgi:hypothetical protein
MRDLYVAAAVVLACAWCVAAPAKADDISTSIGTQHFTNGSTVTSAAYLGAVSPVPAPSPLDQPAPFNAFCGSISGGDCSNVTWTFDYTVPAGDTITGATLTLGILDIESSYGTGNPVGSFTLDTGDDLTSLLNTAAVATNSVSGEYNVLEITIPGADFMDLSNNTAATFALTLSGPGHGALGLTKSHVSGLDFSTLDITATPGSTGPPPPVPEPSTSVLLALGVAALAAKAALNKLA